MRIYAFWMKKNRVIKNKSNQFDQICAGT